MTMLRKSIALGLCTFTVCLSSIAPAQAAALRWTLNNVAFDDDGMATGSFDFDAATSAYANWDITTTTGVAITSLFNYTTANSSLDGSHSPSSLTLVANPQSLLVNSKAANRQRTLTLDWLKALTASGDQAGIADTSKEIQDDKFVGRKAFISAGRYAVSAATGQAAVSAGDTASVPTPLLLPGLVGMGIAAFRRRSAEAASA
jgi:hypothetical protein